MTPRISVIIATYNAEATLRCCLESIAGQKDGSVELLVVDGGSRDGTLEILADFAPLVDQLVSEPDRGIYDAWNKGVARARGEWLLFIGADDTLEQDAFARYFDFLDSHDTTGVDYICARNAYIGKGGQLLKVFGSSWSWETFRRSMHLAHVASLHRRTLFQEVGPFDLAFRIAGDYELLLRKRGGLRSLFLDARIARMATGGASYSMAALREAHQARKLHSGLSAAELASLYLWQVLLYLRHRLLHSR